MSDCVGAPRMPVCRENYPFVCSTIKSPDNVPIEFAIENGASVRIVFLNYQSQKHKHKRSRSRQHVFTALVDNARVNRATIKGLNLRVEWMVKLAKPTIRGTSRPRREMSLRFNALLSRQRRDPSSRIVKDWTIVVEYRSLIMILGRDFAL